MKQRQGKSENTIRKQAGIVAIRKALGFVVLSVGYDGKLHIESDVRRLNNDTDFRQGAVRIIHEKAMEMAVAATELQEKQENDLAQSKKAAELKEARSKELSDAI